MLFPVGFIRQLLAKGCLPPDGSMRQTTRCGADRDRTDDLLVANEALSQTELQPRNIEDCRLNIAN